MRVKLDMPGVHSVPKRLASGTVKTYYYAWRGGPRLIGEPGSAEFIQSYEAARTRRPPPDTLLSIIRAYQSSEAWGRISDRTRRDYAHHIARIEAKFGDMPIGALEDRRVRRVFLDWRNDLNIGARQSDYAFQVLGRIFSWAMIEGHISRNPAVLHRGEKLYRVDRSQQIWEADAVASLMATAPEPIRRALMLALDTGQRQGDLLRLTWKAYAPDDKGRMWIKLTQSKGKRKVAIPVTAELAAVINATPRATTQILTNSKGQPWTATGFRSAWRKAVKAAGVTGLTFHDLRGTTVTRLGEAQATVPEIAAITGHTLRDVEAILERYMGRTKPMAISAIHKLEAARGQNK